MDSLEVAQQIMNLYQQHAPRNSGDIDKSNLRVPIAFCDAYGDLCHINAIEYIDNIGIVLQELP